jgi:predicted component of type VI protein secretion system
MNGERERLTLLEQRVTVISRDVTSLNDRLQQALGLVNQDLHTILEKVQLALEAFDARLSLIEPAVTAASKDYGKQGESEYRGTLDNTDTSLGGKEL